MSEDRQEQFAAYIETLAEVIGHADRAAYRDTCGHASSSCDVGR